ncbi:MAG: hypothetical protein AAF196_08070 [Planctomycetota bacterium]
MNLNSTLGAGLAAVALSFPTLTAQEVVVDYDDSTLGAPEILAPFYTPGAGGAMLRVRAQFICPDSFAGLPSTRMRCTRIGFQVQGMGTYSELSLRAGIAGSSTFDPGGAWNVNLPDQTLQFDGAFIPQFAPVTSWLEYPLAQPFVYNPGDSVCVDLTTFVAPFSIGSVLQPVRTTTETGRNVDFDFQGLPTAAGGPRPDGGIKFRMVFEPIGAPYQYGAGCAAPSTSQMTIDGTGLATPGGAFTVDLTNGTAAGAFLFVGFSNTTSAFGPLPFSFGGGCDLLTSIDASLSLLTDGMGNASLPLAVPNNPALVGQSLFFQGGEVNLGSPATLFPVVLSNGLGVEFE